MKRLTNQAVWEISETPKEQAGSYGQDPFGRIWVYVQASVVLVQGNAVEPASYASIDADVDAAAAADTIRVTGTGDFATTVLVDMAPTTKNGHTYYLWIDDGASQGQGGPIVNRASNNAVDVYWMQSDDGKIDTALTTTSDFIVFTLSRVAKGAAAQMVIGFVQRQGGVTDEYWFWALAKGFGVALIDTSDTAITGGLPVIPGTAAGTLEGAEGTSTPTPDALYKAGWGLIDSDADSLIPIIADCPICAAPTIPERVTAPYPKR